MDWTGLLRIGMSELRLHPSQFWDLTPIELMAMLGHLQNEQAVLGRKRLDELIAQYPD